MRTYCFGHWLNVFWNDRKKIKSVQWKNVWKQKTANFFSYFRKMNKMSQEKKQENKWSDIDIYVGKMVRAPNNAVITDIFK